jgi:hypothetical protein
VRAGTSFEADQSQGYLHVRQFSRDVETGGGDMKGGLLDLIGAAVLVGLLGAYGGFW